VKELLTDQPVLFVADVDPLIAIHSPTPSYPNKYSTLCEKPTEEWQLLSELQPQGALRLDCAAAWNAQAYLEARRIPLDIASRVGIAYIAPQAAHQHGTWLRPWEDRLLFPLITPNGEVGFTGRLLTHWQSCGDVAAHQARLRAEGHDPWIKTGQPGWFWDPQHLPHSEPIVVVEGPFDRLAVLAAGGFEAGEVVALVGTPFQPAWLSHANAVLFALNRTQSSKEAIEQLQRQLAWNRSIRGDVCRVPTRGSNWSERWRREGDDGLELLYVDYALLAHGL
jgi:hypothetical protein